jgi:hypothetical protein
LHAWELLKHGGWGGALLGLIIGLERQHVPWSAVLYSLSHREGAVAIQGDRITYQVVEITTFPYKLGQHELYFLPLIVWAFAASLVAMFVVGLISQQRTKTKSRMPTTTKPRAGAEPTQKQTKPE